MISSITDQNGIPVMVGDTVVFPYIDPSGRITKEPDFKKVIVFEYGCFGYYSETHFVPLFNWMRTEQGTYVPNCGNKVIYTNSYPFWVEEITKKD